MRSLTRILVCLIVSALLFVVASAGEASDVRDDSLVFEVDVRPILAKHCFRCHNKKSHKGELNLSDAAGVRRGGELGEIVVAGEVASSRLFELVESGEMPPDKEKRLAPPRSRRSNAGSKVEHASPRRRTTTCRG